MDNSVLELWTPCLDNLMASTSGPQTFLAPGTGFVEDNFSTDREGEEGWFGDDSGTLHLLCTLFLSLLHQLNLRSSGIKSWRLGTPALGQAFLLIILPAVSLCVHILCLKEVMWIGTGPNAKDGEGILRFFLCFFFFLHVSWDYSELSFIIF